ncbi:MAG: TniQ family protein [Colwellia sp.]|nr:TniQ family protein [Colwellia sp.]
MFYLKTNERLLIRPRVNYEESFQSYLIGLARANGYKYSAFSSGITAKSKPHRSFKPEDRNDIQTLISKIADDNAGNLVDVWECGYYFKHLFDYSRIKACPKCYEKDMILPPYWWLKNYLVCGEHKLLLIDSCSQCNTKFEEGSFVKEHCLKCGLEITSNNSIEWNTGLLDQRLHDLCSDVTRDSNQFKELISEEIEQIYVHYQVCSYFLKELQSKDKYSNHRRTLDINTLNSEQNDIQRMIHDGKVSLLMYDALAAYRIKSGKRISSFITPIFKLLMSQHGSLYKAELINMLIEGPNDFGDWPVGLNWVEKLLSIKANDLKVFVKDHFPNIEAKCQGPFAVLIRDLNFLLSEYSKNSRDFKLP